MDSGDAEMCQPTDKAPDGSRDEQHKPEPQNATVALRDLPYRSARVSLKIAHA
jgi:hypothetical protein